MSYLRGHVRRILARIALGVVLLSILELAILASIPTPFSEDGAPSPAQEVADPDLLSPPAIKVVISPAYFFPTPVPTATPVPCSPAVLAAMRPYDHLRNIDEIVTYYLPPDTYQELTRYAGQGSIYASGPDSPNVALTFDDGPSLYTPQVLATLRHYHIHATFFVTGQNASRYPDLVRQAIAEGNVVGNHSFDHPHLAYFGTEGIQAELDSTALILKQITGASPTLFRPPYGSISPAVLSVSKARGYTMALWSVSSDDWDNPGVATITTSTVNRTRNGAIILLHDAGGNREQTVAALPTIIEALQARGYHFVTIPELIHPKG